MVFFGRPTNIVTTGFFCRNLLVSFVNYLVTLISFDLTIKLRVAVFLVIGLLA